MKSAKLMLMLFIVLGCCWGCTKTVNVSVKNGYNASLSGKLIEKDKEKKPMSTITMGNFSSTQLKTKTLKMKPGQELSVQGQFEGSPVVYNDSYTITSADQDEFDLSFTMKPSRNRASDEPEDIFKKSFSLLGPYLEFDQIPVTNALNTIFGGIVVVTPKSEGVPESIDYMVYASQLGSITDVAKFKYPTRSSSKKIETNGKLMASLGVNVPLAATLSSSLKKESLYQLRWEIKNFGPVLKEIPDGWTIEGALSKLSDAQKASIASLLKANPNRRVIWVNKAYVVEAAFLEMKEGRSVESDTKMEGIQYVSGSAVWQFAETSENKDLVGGAVVNITGVPVVVPQSDKKPESLFATENVKVKKIKLGDVDVVILNDMAAIKALPEYQFGKVMSEYLESKIYFKSRNQ